MPVLQITALPQPQADVPALLERLALVTADAMGCDWTQVWVTWNELKPGHYFIGEKPNPDAQPETSHDPVARLMSYEGREDAVIERTLTAIAEALSAGLGLAPGTAFVVYDELKPGRVFTGGGVRN